MSVCRLLCLQRIFSRPAAGDCAESEATPKHQSDYITHGRLRWSVRGSQGWQLSGSVQTLQPRGLEELTLGPGGGDTENLSAFFTLFLKTKSCSETNPGGNAQRTRGPLLWLLCDKCNTTVV